MSKDRTGGLRLVVAAGDPGRRLKTDRRYAVYYWTTLEDIFDFR